MKPVRTLLLYAASSESNTLSYQRGWPRQFLAHPRFRCTAVNVLERRDRIRARLDALLHRRYDAVVALHSVFSNVRYLPETLAAALAGMRAVKAYFIGNEYKLMPQKIRFCEELGVDLLVSQFTDERPLNLYRARLDAKVIGIPNTGLDTQLFAPTMPWDDRPIDLGYRAYDTELALGHRERSEIAKRVGEAAARHGLEIDISLNPAARFDEPGWAGFLNRCKGQLGSEAGGDYFELTDETRLRVQAYLDGRPDATFEDVDQSFFRAYGDAVPGRALSGRIVEAAGTKTVQILLEGEYGGYFEPDVHYIPLRKDFSNVEEALAKFLDPAHAQRVRDSAYEVAVSELTYDRLISRFHDELSPLL